MSRAKTGGLISDGIVTFPVYTLPSNNTPCSYDIGKGSVYRMTLFDARPVTDVNDDGEIETSEREIPLLAHGIPPDVVAHRDEAGRLSVCVGLECQQSDPTADPNAPSPVHENYWYTRN
ncbi:MAG: hypothetical protein AAF499_13840 [Pseudomonadota bacterium]